MGGGAGVMRPRLLSQQQEAVTPTRRRRCNQAPGNCWVTWSPELLTWPLTGRLRPSTKMAAYLQWRRFVFFDKELVKEPLGNDGPAPGAAPNSGSAAPKFLCLPPGITVCDSGRGSIVFGDILALKLSLPFPDPWRDTAGMESFRHRG